MSTPFDVIPCHLIPLEYLLARWMVAIVGTIGSCGYEVRSWLLWLDNYYMGLSDQLSMVTTPLNCLLCMITNLWLPFSRLYWHSSLFPKFFGYVGQLFGQKLIVSLFVNNTRLKVGYLIHCRAQENKIIDFRIVACTMANLALWYLLTMSSMIGAILIS